MKKETEDCLNDFFNHIDELFLKIEEWSKNNGLITKRLDISISEEACGSYHIDKLLITDGDRNKVAEIVPVGAWILGANGRVDIKGHYETLILVDLDKGGPSTTITTEDGVAGKHTYTKSFYRGIDENGWYWIDSTVSSKGHKLSQNFFLDLLEKVSGYVYERS